MDENVEIISDIDTKVKSVFRKEIFCFRDDDIAVYNKDQRVVHIKYLSQPLSPSQCNHTDIDLCLCRDTKNVWISSLHVAASFRLIGIGRKLVHAAEEIARSMDFEKMCVYPLQSSRSFWEKLGYRTHYCTHRALSKTLNNPDNSMSERV